MKHLFLSYFLLFNIYAHAQKHDNIWLFGGNDQVVYGTYLNFNSQNDSIYKENRAMDLRFSYPMICDAAGNLLFYSNGTYIADSSHQMMLNGNNINPGSIAQNYYPASYPWAEMAMALSSITVILNSLRIPTLSKRRQDP